MVAPKPAAPEHRITYRTDFTLSETAWDAIAAEAKKRTITGRRLLEQLLEQWAYAHPSATPHPKPAMKPRPAPKAWADEPEQLSPYEAFAADKAQNGDDSWPITE